MHISGILMPVSSLPSNHGIGDFGKESYKFIDILKESSVAIWQILPLGPLGYGNSPYQPYSSFAGDEIYISLDLLTEIGLLKEKIPFYRKKKKRIIYEKVRKYKETYIKKAYENFEKQKIIKNL